MVAVILAVVAWQPYDAVRTALPYIGGVCALFLLWRMYERRRATG
jgi:hypothetical protein